MVQVQNLQQFVGKTILAIDDKACNCLTIRFTDNTLVLLEAENAGPPMGLLAISKYVPKNEDVACIR